MVLSTISYSRRDLRSVDVSRAFLKSGKFRNRSRRSTPVRNRATVVVRYGELVSPAIAT